MALYQIDGKCVSKTFADRCNKERRAESTVNTIFSTLGGAFQGFMGGIGGTPANQRTQFEQTVLDTRDQVRNQIGQGVYNDTSQGIGKFMIPILIGIVAIFLLKGLFNK